MTSLPVPTGCGWAPEAIDQGWRRGRTRRGRARLSAMVSPIVVCGVSVAGAGAGRLRPGRGHLPAGVHRPAGTGVPGVGAAVGGEVDDVVEVADVPAGEVDRLERRALAAVACCGAEGRVPGELRAPGVGFQTPPEIL